MKKSILLFANVIVFINLSNITLANELSPEIEAIMDAVIQAHEAEASSSKKGGGFADVSIVTKSGTKIHEREIQRARFWFKDRSRRTDFLPLDPEISNNSTLTSRVDNGEFFYRYNQFLNAAGVDRSGKSGFKGKLTEDFHPDVFLNWINNVPLSRAFKRMKNNPDLKLKVQFTDKGFLEFMSSYNKKVKYGSQIMDSRADAYFLLDPKHSYRILAYHNEEENVNGPGSAHIHDVKVDWYDYGSGETYPKSVKGYYKLIRSTDQLKHPPEGVKKLDRESERHVDINIKEFKPNINIDESIFTLKGMGVKKGTKVNDQISGIFYIYGGTKVTDASLESLLNDSESTRFTSGMPDTHLNKTPQKESKLNHLSKEDDVSVVVTATTYSTRQIIITIVFIMAIIVGGLLLLFRIVARKRHEK